MIIDEVRLGYLSSSYQRFVEYQQHMYDYWWKDIFEPPKTEAFYKQKEEFSGEIDYDFESKPTYSLQRGDELFLHRFGGTVQCFPICYSAFFRGGLS